MRDGYHTGGKIGLDVCVRFRAFLYFSGWAFYICGRAREMESVRAAAREPNVEIICSLRMFFFLFGLMRGLGNVGLKMRY